VGEKERSPLIILGRIYLGAPANFKQAGVMISAEIIQNKSFFILLHQIDHDLAEIVRCNGCPTVGGLCITLGICVSLGEVLLIFKRFILPV